MIHKSTNYVKNFLNTLYVFGILYSRVGQREKTRKPQNITKNMFGPREEKHHTTNTRKFK